MAPVLIDMGKWIYTHEIPWQYSDCFTGYVSCYYFFLYTAVNYFSQDATDFTYQNLLFSLWTFFFKLFASHIWDVLIPIASSKLIYLIKSVERYSIIINSLSYEHFRSGEANKLFALFCFVFVLQLQHIITFRTITYAMSGHYLHNNCQRSNAAASHLHAVPAIIDINNYILVSSFTPV